jgi:hypothetical protein
MRLIVGPFSKNFFTPIYFFEVIESIVFGAFLLCTQEGIRKIGVSPFFSSFKTIWKNSGASKSSINQHSPAISNVIWRNE